MPRARDLDFVLTLPARFSAGARQIAKTAGTGEAPLCRLDALAARTGASLTPAGATPRRAWPRCWVR